MERRAILDLGTNTFNLLVVEWPSMAVVHSSELPVFLGQGGIEQGLLTDAAMERGMEALRGHARTAAELGANGAVGFGTSALRSARNGASFVERVREELGIVITIIPGDEEATLILEGVRQAVPFGKKPALVMDIGGGSIEFILATDKALMWERSFELGVTRLRERIPVQDPMTMTDQLRLGAHLDDRLAPLYAVMDRHWPDTLVGSAGSFDTLAAMIAAERGMDFAGTDRTLTFTALEFDQLKDKLLGMDRAERARVPGMPAHRVETNPYALVAIERVLAHGITRIHWSRYALKEGAAWRMLHGTGTLDR